MDTSSSKKVNCVFSDAKHVSPICPSSGKGIRTMCEYVHEICTISEAMKLALGAVPVGISRGRRVREVRRLDKGE